MKTSRISLITLSLLLSSAAFGQQIVPPIDSNIGYIPTATQVSSIPVAPAQAKLSAKEQKAIGLAKEWINQQDVPMRGENGTVVFPFGATLPTVVCTPMHLCDVSLQPGEQVNQVDVGDNVRWKVTPATSGSGEKTTTHLILKATMPDLTTNLIVNTDRRTYSIKLVSRKEEWMPMVAFQFPEDAQEVWKAYAKKQYEAKEVTVLPSGQEISALDFSYRVSGDSPKWKPMRVYTDHEKTYIQFPKNIKYGDAPVLVAIGAKDKEQLVNYRMDNDRYIVDKVLDHAALISGVGRSQAKVEIVRESR